MSIRRVLVTDTSPLSTTCYVCDCGPVLCRSAGFTLTCALYFFLYISLSVYMFRHRGAASAFRAETWTNRAKLASARSNRQIRPPESLRRHQRSLWNTNTADLSIDTQNVDGLSFHLLYGTSIQDDVCLSSWPSVMIFTLFALLWIEQPQTEHCKQQQEPTGLWRSSVVCVIWAVFGNMFHSD